MEKNGPVAVEGNRSPTKMFVESPTKRVHIQKLVHKATGKVWATLKEQELVIKNKVWQKQLEEDMGIAIPLKLRQDYRGQRFVLKKDGQLFTKAFLEVWLPRHQKVEWQ